MMRRKILGNSAKERNAKDQKLRLQVLTTVNMSDKVLISITHCTNHTQMLEKLDLKTCMDYNMMTHINCKKNVRNFKYNSESSMRKNMPSGKCITEFLHRHSKPNCWTH